MERRRLAGLQPDHIDIYQIHGLDLATPIEETMYALDNLERELVLFLLSEKVGLLVWTPLAGVLLSGKYSRDGHKRIDYAYNEGRPGCRS